MTDTQKQVLRFVREHIFREGFAPTARETAEAFGWKSPWSAQKHIRSLVRLGHLEQVKGKSRGVRLPRGR